MTATYESALETLYRGGVEEFVAERKRLAAELKAAGDKEGAARFLKLGRPTSSAWAVNQLWWRERERFDELLNTAARVRDGELAALSAHRHALSALRQRAAALLTEAGHGAPDAVLRRVTTTLSALAAAGGFEPDTAGALSSDREPLGFGAMESAAFPESDAQPKPERRSTAEPEPQKERAGHAAKQRAAEKGAAERPDAKQRAAEKRAAEKREAERREAEKREAERQREAERKRKEELARLRAERTRRKAELEQAQHEVERRQAELARVEAELNAKRQALAEARAAAESAAERLAELPEE